MPHGQHDQTKTASTSHGYNHQIQTPFWPQQGSNTYFRMTNQLNERQTGKEIIKK